MFMDAIDLFLEELVLDAPAEIRDDLQTVSDGLNFHADGIAQNAELIGNYFLLTDEIHRINTYTQNECGIILL